MRIVYLSNKPKFIIGVDRFQWILSFKQNNRGEWIDKLYYPKICLLFDDLAEICIRLNTKKVNNLNELNKSISKVYKLISDICVGCGKALLKGDRCRKDKDGC